MEPTRRIMIACAGPQNKWKNHKGVPSHLVRDRTGEPILHRTIRQLAEQGVDRHEIVIVAPPGDDRYTLPGIETVGTHAGLTEFHSTMDHWKQHPGNRNVLLLGDVFFTDSAIRRILRYEGYALKFFGHSERNLLTGSPYGELLGYSWCAESNPAIKESLVKIERMQQQRRVTRFTGWELLRWLQGTDLNKHLVLPGYLEEIVDLSGDLDYPRDLRHHPSFGD